MVFISDRYKNLLTTKPLPIHTGINNTKNIISYHCVTKKQAEYYFTMVPGDKIPSTFKVCEPSSLSVCTELVITSRCTRVTPCKNNCWQQTVGFCCNRECNPTHYVVNSYILVFLRYIKIVIPIIIGCVFAKLNCMQKTHIFIPTFVTPFLTSYEFYQDEFRNVL